MVAVVRRADVQRRGTPTQRYWHAAAKRERPPRRDVEAIAFRLGCRVDAVRRAIEMGLI
jgi:hypothetical protein